MLSTMCKEEKAVSFEHLLQVSSFFVADAEYSTLKLKEERYIVACSLQRIQPMIGELQGRDTHGGGVSQRTNSS